MALFPSLTNDFVINILKISSNLLCYYSQYRFPQRGLPAHSKGEDARLMEVNGALAIRNYEG